MTKHAVASLLAHSLLPYKRRMTGQSSSYSRNTTFPFRVFCLPYLYLYVFRCVGQTNRVCIRVCIRVLRVAPDDFRLPGIPSYVLVVLCLTPPRRVDIYGAISVGSLSQI